MNNVKSLKEIVKQLRSCGYTCEAGPLENNVDFQMLERIAGYVPAEHAFGEGVGKRIEKAKQRAVSDTADDLFAQLMSMPPHRPKPKSPQEIRDDIIEQAKRDVAGILGEYDSFNITVNGYEKQAVKAKFVVNAEKRTIVVLIYGYFTGKLYHRGIAKCAPDDCFNAAIGRAIALRRALGLEVLAEYLSAPPPTEARIGDVVQSISSMPIKYRVVDKPDLLIKRGECAPTSIVAKKGKIIDDSRE